MYRKDILMGILLICLVFNMGACSPSQPMEDLQEQETAEAFDPVENIRILLFMRRFLTIMMLRRKRIPSPEHRRNFVLILFIWMKMKSPNLSCTVRMRRCRPVPGTMPASVR